MIGIDEADRATASHDADRSVVLEVLHDTTYRYASEVALAHHVAFLQPPALPYQALEAFTLRITPKPSVQRTDRDVFGNARVHFSFETPHPRLAVRAASRVKLSPRFDAFDPASTKRCRAVADCIAYRANGTYVRESEFAYASPFVPRHRELGDYAEAAFERGATVAEGAIELMHRIRRDFVYDADSTDVSTPVLEAFETRRGVCQDFAHVMIGGLRAMGLAARYVSGYLLTRPPPGQKRLVGADASHAWVSVWCPSDDGASTWLDLDPTNNVIPSTSHVTLAIGRDFGDVSPLRGIIRGGGDHRLSVAVTVRPLGET